jgi:hypothetical protein
MLKIKMHKTNMILKVEHDLDNVPTYLEKEVKTIPSYTAPKGPPEKRRGE